MSRYWASLSGFFRAKLGDEAAELIAETFLACVEGKDRIEGELRAYLFAIARRRLADHFRKRAHAPELDVLRSSLVDLATGPVTEVGRREQGALLRQGLARIPLDDQIALELAYFERLTTRELAAVLEIPENTVRSRLSRARDKLRTVLVELGTPEAASLAESQLDTDQGK